MMFKEIKQLNPIGAMKTFTKPYFILCMGERLTIQKKLCDKRAIVINKKLEIYRACREKTAFHRFCIITDSPVSWLEGLGRTIFFKP